MKRRIVSGLMLILLAINVLTLASNVQYVGAIGTIFIRADGSVDPLTAPIQRDGDIFTFTDHSYNEVVVERDNIVVDGAGYTFQGTGHEIGIYLSFRNNVTVKNAGFANFTYGIYLYYSSNITLTGNTASNNSFVGIYLYQSINNVLTGNTASLNNEGGIYLLYSSSNNLLSGNTALDNLEGIAISESSNNNVVTGNTASNNEYGIYLRAFGNNITGNTFSNNWCGICLERSNSTLFHNNLIDNTHQVRSHGYVNKWDNGYPSGGNYWGDYIGTDENGDGIGDTSYIIDENNQDHYPLMSSWGTEELPPPAEEEPLPSAEDATPLWMLWWFWAIITVIFVAVVGVIYFLKKRKPSTTPLCMHANLIGSGI